MKFILLCVIFIIGIAILNGYYPLQTLATSEDQQDLESFSNSEYGFSIGYPKVLEPSEKDRETSYSVWFDTLGSFGDPDVPTMLVMLDVKPNDMPLLEYINNDYLENPLTHENTPPESIMVDDTQGYKYTSTTDNSEIPVNEGVLAHGDHIYHLTFITTGDTSDKIIGDYLFDLMLNSFEFN
jgi:hypothetical protein